jgi:hypothetical protein
MDPSENNGKVTADVHSTTEALRDFQHIRISPERAAFPSYNSGTDCWSGNSPTALRS